MGRKPDYDRLDQMLIFIQQNPDLKAAEIGRSLDLDNQTVQRGLMQLEARGDLLQEDQKGHIRWFGRRR